MSETENMVLDGGAAQRRDARVKQLTLAWAALGSVWVSMTLVDRPFIWDGVLSARLVVFGGLALAVAAPFILPRFWRIDRANPGWGTQSLRAWCATVAFLLATLSITLAVNSRDLVFIALGADDLAGGIVYEVSPRVIEISGPLSAGIASQVRARLAQQPEADTLLLNSEGGWVSEGERIGKLVSQFSLDTHTDIECSSACAAAFVYGRRRTLSPGALLGFHSASGEGSDPVYIQWTNEWMAERLVEIGVSAPFVERAFSTPASDMWYPPHDQLMSEGIIHDVTQ